MLKYRDLFPNAPKSEYLYKKDPKNEKVIRCIKLKYSDDNETPEREREKKTIVEGNYLIFNSAQS